MRKKDTNYYRLFIEMGEYSVTAAELLDKTLNNFDYNKIDELTLAIHKIEHEADIKRHELLEKLAKEFMTPIEREDILHLADKIDNVIDSIEEIMMRIYMYNIKEIKTESLKLTEAIVRSTKALVSALKEFENFRKSKELKARLIEVKTLEEKSDEIYIQAVRKLYSEESDAVKVVAWTNLYDAIEVVSDRCEHVCNIIESVILKNS